MRNTPEYIKSKLCNEIVLNETEIHMQPICFSERMMNKLLTRGGDNAILELSQGEVYYDREIPKKNHCYYIAEPFLKNYSIDINGMYIPSHIIYQADRSERQYDGEFDSDLDTSQLKSEAFASQAMLEKEARLFIKVRQCRYRTFKSLSLGEILHDNTYELKKYSRVLLLTFDVVTKQEALQRCAEVEWEEFYEKYM